QVSMCAVDARIQRVLARKGSRRGTNRGLPRRCGALFRSHPTGAAKARDCRDRDLAAAVEASKVDAVPMNLTARSGPGRLQKSTEPGWRRRWTCRMRGSKGPDERGLHSY